MVGADDGYELTPKNQQIAALLAQLSKIRGERVDSFSATYLFSHDRSVSSLIPEMKTHLKTANSDLRVGIVVGTGGLYTLGKELPEVDLWIMIDRNTQIIEGMRSWADYLSAVSDVAEVRNVTLTPEVQPYYDIEKESYGNYHYTSSQKGLIKTQEFISKRNIAYVNGDLTDQELMQSFGDTLRGYKAQVVFANMTNVGEWVKRESGSMATLKQGLGVLPVYSDCYFMYSQQDKTQQQPRRQDIPLFVHGVIGVDSYLTNA